MGNIRIESYDGEGAYVAGSHLDAFELNGKYYLVKDMSKGDGSSHLEILDAYRVTSKSTAVKITNKSLIGELEKIVSKKRIDQIDAIRSDPHFKEE